MAVRFAGAAVLAAGVVLLAGRMAALSSSPDSAIQAALTVAGSAVMLAFAAGPLLVGAEDPLDPRRFRTLGMEPRPLSWALLLAALVSVPSMLLIVYNATAAAVWLAVGADGGLVAFAAIAHTISCLLFSRVAMATRSAFFGGAGVSRAAGVFLLAALLAVVPAAVLMPVQAEGAAAIAAAMAFTPFGAMAALPGASLEGDGALVWGVAVIGAAAIAIAAALWGLLVRRLLTTVEHPVVARGESGLGWFALMPANATGAIAARSLLYWLRDTRYLANVVAIPIAGIIPVFALLIAGMPLASAALLPIPLMALFYGWLAHNDLAYDSSAVWLHIASGVRGVSDRTGRLAPVLVIAVPVLVAAVLIALGITGQWRLLPAASGAAFALLLSGLGLSSVASVVAPYAVSQPGDGPFQQPQRTDSTGVWSQAVVLLGSLLLSAPTLWLAVASTVDADESPFSALWTGLATGTVVLVAGIAIGAAVFERRGTRLMEFAGAS
jgi:ABC-2 type transport system permease protein